MFCPKFFQLMTDYSLNQIAETYDGKPIEIILNSGVRIKVKPMRSACTAYSLVGEYIGEETQSIKIRHQTIAAVITPGAPVSHDTY